MEGLGSKNWMMGGIRNFLWKVEVSRNFLRSLRPSNLNRHQLEGLKSCGNPSFAWKSELKLFWGLEGLVRSRKKAEASAWLGGLRPNSHNTYVSYKVYSESLKHALYSGEGLNDVFCNFTKNPLSAHCYVSISTLKYQGSFKTHMKKKDDVGKINWKKRQVLQNHPLTV